MIGGVKKADVWRAFNTTIILILGTVLVSVLASLLVSVPVFAACTNWAGLPDNDCDQLADEWETSGYNGLILPGANPNHKDVYLELDYMNLHAPRSGVVSAVVTAFDNSGVSNPDGDPGITLHVDVDEVIPHQNSITMWSTFDTLKDTWFGTSDAERANSALMQAKDNTYHYALFIHQYNGLSSSGLAELPGDDLVISLGAPGWGTVNGHNVGTTDQQKGTLMHELGHNLGLRHGGDVDENCKPNYLSVMSYSFQLSNFVSNRPLDYSKSKLNPLTEAAGLDEPNGVSPASTPSGLSTVYGPNSALVSPPLNSALNPIDWKRDGDTTDNDVTANINNLGSGTGCTSTLNTPLGGYKDWTNLKYWGTTGGWADGNETMTGNFTIPANETILGNVTISANETILGNFTIPANETGPANLTSTGELSESRIGLDEMNVENLVSSRHSQLESIGSYIRSFDDSDFAPPASGSRNGLIGITRAIEPTLISSNLTPAINGLVALRERMDNFDGGNPNDDLLTTPDKQRLVAGQIDNFIQALQKQQ
jgi:hypothetical protein